MTVTCEKTHSLSVVIELKRHHLVLCRIGNFSMVSMVVKRRPLLHVLMVDVVGQHHKAVQEPTEEDWAERRVDLCWIS